MTLAAGSRLGPYEILSPLGAGGMGEVYRARDTRLSRDVAIKVLPEDLATDPSRLKRFEREAQAASALSHPNVVTIYEVASAEGASFIAMELVEGKTLREIVAGAPLAFRKVLAIAPQIAEALARAHAAGIVHRDLKPENVMVTADNIVKVLDFGLAKLTHPQEDSGQTESAMTVSAATRPGLAMGTAAYMSPEQASGHPVDFRSDQFSFGSILYEMATGVSPFKRATTAQTLAAIIDEEPDPVGAVAPKTPAPLRWVIARCLSKEPRGRYASSDDLARELSDLRDHVSDLSSGSGVAIEPPRRRPRWGALGWLAGGAAALAGMFALGQRIQSARTPTPRYRQLTVRGAGISTARFTPDGQAVVFSSETEGRPSELYMVRLDSFEVRSLGLPPAHILSIAPNGQMAILLLKPFALLPRVCHIADVQAEVRDPYLLAGTLAQTALAGGAPRELLDDVLFADWNPAGDSLAAVHRVGNRNRVEFPIGNAVFDEEEVFLNHPRVSSGNGVLAFKDWSGLLMKPGGGPTRRFPWAGYEVAWSEPTGELWFSERGIHATEIRAISRSGRYRNVATLPADFTLYDISADGRVLLGRLNESFRVLGSFPGEAGERDLSYFDQSGADDLSVGGDLLLFNDVARSETADGSIYLRKTDGSASKRLAETSDTGVLSPDGALVLSSDDSLPEGSVHILLPTGPGQPRRIAVGGGVRSVYTENRRHGFLPGQKSVYFTGYEKGHRRRIWIQDLDGGKPRPITPEDTSRPVLLGDSVICARGPEAGWRLYPISGSGDAPRVVGLLPGEEPIHGSPDGRWLYVRGADELRPGETLMATRVHRLDPRTGERALWKEIPSARTNAGGVIMTILFSGDGKTCVWTHVRYTTELVVVDGLK